MAGTIQLIQEPVLASPTGAEALFAQSVSAGVVQLILTNLAAWLADGGLLFKGTTDGITLDGHTYKLAIINGLLNSVKVS